MPFRVLLIDDDQRLHQLLSAYLTKHDCVITSAYDGSQGLSKLRHDVFDIALVDVMMPGLSGLDVVRRLRTTSQLPVIMLTARGDDMDRVVGLELGADDYVPKPFNPRELLARMRAVLRRAQPTVISERLQVQDLILDVDARQARRGDSVLDLTGLEFDLLLALARRAGRVVSREALLAAAGRDDVSVSARVVDVHISRLRQKLGDAPRAPALIKTVRGIGYTLTRDGSP